MAKQLKLLSTIVPCSDWWRSWGLGHNKLGKLSRIDETHFLWKGKSQGRHNQTLRNTWSTILTVEDGHIINATDSYPEREDVLKAIETLKNIEHENSKIVLQNDKSIRDTPKQAVLELQQCKACTVPIVW